MDRFPRHWAWTGERMVLAAVIVNVALQSLIYMLHQTHIIGYESLRMGGVLSLVGLFCVPLITGLVWTQLSQGTRLVLTFLVAITDLVGAVTPIIHLVRGMHGAQLGMAAYLAVQTALFVPFAVGWRIARLRHLR